MLPNEKARNSGAQGMQRTEDRGLRTEDRSQHSKVVNKPAGFKIVCIGENRCSKTRKPEVFERSV